MPRPSRDWGLIEQDLVHQACGQQCAIERRAGLDMQFIHPALSQPAEQGGQVDAAVCSGRGDLLDAGKLGPRRGPGVHQAGLARSGQHAGLWRNAQVRVPR